MLKKLSLVVFAGLLGLAAVPAARAQNYRPFGPGRTYHYAWLEGARTLISMFRVDSVAVAGADSLFYFNYGYTQFGGTFRWQAATGVATFTIPRSQNSVQILTRAAIGQQWNFLPNVQATLLSRQPQLVLGQPDTVATIALSDGRQLSLARRHGLVNSPGFDAYFYPSQPMISLQLYAIPELGLGSTDLRNISLFAHRVGDILYYWGQNSSRVGSGTPVCNQYRERRIIRTVQLDPTGDTLWLTAEVRRVSGLCNSAFTTDTTLQKTWYEAVAKSHDKLTGGAPNTALTTDLAIIDTAFNGLPWVKETYFPGRQHTTWTYAPSLGNVEYRFQSLNGGYYFRLVGYIRGATRWGNTTLPAPLAVATAIERMPASLAPNPAPAGTASTLSLHLDQPQAVALTIYDATGRAVWQQTTAVRAGPQRLPVGAGAALAPGLYRLRVSLADGRQRLLPLVRE